MLYTDPPQDFIKEIDVVGCYVMYKDMFVLLHRHAHKSNGDKWGLPAGKREKEETLEAAILRELKEETNLEISINDLHYFESVFVRHNQHDFEYHMFSLPYTLQPDIHINPYEHQAFMWVTPEQALRLPLVADQDACVRRFYTL